MLCTPPGMSLLRTPPRTEPPRGAASARRREELFPGVSEAEWNDFRWQARHSVRNLEQLERVVRLTDEEREGVRRTASLFHLAITPYYLTLIDDHPHCPVCCRRDRISATGCG